MTIRDVAKGANVSIATVSRVLNNLDTVSRENKKKVLDAVKELNYFSDAAASNLKKNSSNVIGIVVPTITNEYFTQIIKGIEDYFGKTDYIFYIASSDNDPDKENSILRKLVENKAEGIILASSGSSEEFITEVARLDVNLIAIDRRLNITPAIDFVGENNFQTAYDMTKVFLSKIGKKKIALLGGLEKLSVGKERFSGAEQALKEEQSEFEYFDGRHSEQEAKKRFLEIKSKYPNGCGIISLNNAMTSGVIQEIFDDENEVVEEKYPIASYGEINFQKIFSKIILVSVRQFPYEVGIETAKLLKEKIEKNDSISTTKLIKNEIL